MMETKNKFGKILIAFFALIFLTFSSVEAASFSAGDNSLPLGITRVGTSDWTNNITNVSAGEKLNISTYYYSATEAATNARVVVSVTPGGSSNVYNVTSTLIADGFSPYTNTAIISLNYTAPSYQYDANARWLHDAQSESSGHGYNTTDYPAASISGTEISYNLGTIEPGYINDGYIEFYITFDPKIYIPPTANAGPDQTVGSGATVQLNASGSTGEDISYNWNCDSGVSLNNSSVVNPTFTAPSVSSAQTYTCTLTVTDSTSATATDSTAITVNPITPGAPTANAGTDQTVTSGATVQLNGSSSSGENITYGWQCDGGISLSSETIVNPTFTAPSVSSAQTYTCTLTVTDSTSATATDSTVITVNPASTGGGGGGGGGAVVYYGGDVSAEILPVTKNTGVSVVFNGKMTECEKNNCRARFNWGDAEVLGNKTEWIEGIKQGESFLQSISGLERGKTYYVGIEAELEVDSFKTDTPLEFTTAPGVITNLKITLNGSNSAEISWNKGEGSQSTLIKKKANECPEANDENVQTVYLGDGNNTIDSNLSIGTTYCYRLWSLIGSGTDIILSSPIQQFITSSSGIFSPGFEEEEEDDEEAEELPSKPENTPSTESSLIVSEENNEEAEQNYVYSLSLKNLARNISAEQLNWEKEISAETGDKLEFYIEIQNIGNGPLSRVYLENIIDEQIKDIADIKINGVSYSLDALDKSYIKTLPAEENIVITFSAMTGDYSEDQPLIFLTKTYSDQTKEITDIVKIARDTSLSSDDLSASLFSTILSGGWLPWIILLIIIIILTIIYLILQRRKDSAEEENA